MLSSILSTVNTEISKKENQDQMNKMYMDHMYPTIYPYVYKIMLIVLFIIMLLVFSCSLNLYCVLYK